MIFYDFEVFKHDWLVVLIDPTKKEETDIVNDLDKLQQFYDENKDDIWVGFNSRHYDQYILKGILLGMDPWKINEWIIVKGKDGWMYSSLFRQIQLNNYDVMIGVDKGLKWYEGSMGSMIKESDISFLLDRKMTAEEIEETLLYCRHDVEETIKVFIERKDDFNAHISLIKMFPEVLNISDISKTKAQMSAKILECEKIKRDDEFDLFVLPCIQIKKYKQAIEFFLNPENHDYSNRCKMMISGLEHTIGWGGIHAGKEKYQNSGVGRQIWHVDVASFYPRLMIFHNLLTRNSKKPEKFKMIYDRRIQLKHEGKKKEQAPLKIVINGTYGISKAKDSTAYDPRNANLICLNGQLMLIDLIEHLEVIDGFELIQSNTDGLIVSLPDTDKAFEQMDDICYEWEKRCNMELEFDQIGFEGFGIAQKDVNNYVFQFSNGKVERKGAYVKELSNLDYGDFPIVNKALVDYMIHKVPVEKTIGSCDLLKEFQMVTKIGNKYKHLIWGSKILNEKCVRVFASTDYLKGNLTKVSVRTNKPEKVANSPEHCFLWNEAIDGVKVPQELNKQWYIDMANKRLNDFGVVNYA